MKYKDGSETNVTDATAMIVGFIQKFGENTDERFMDVGYCKRCKDFDPATGDAVAHLRDLVDICVYSSGCADNLIRMMKIVLEPFDPEDKTAQEARRETLLERWSSTK